MNKTQVAEVRLIENYRQEVKGGFLNKTIINYDAFQIVDLSGDNETILFSVEVPIPNSPDLLAWDHARSKISRFIHTNNWIITQTDTTGFPVFIKRIQSFDSDNSSKREEHEDKNLSFEIARIKHASNYNENKDFFTLQDIEERLVKALKKDEAFLEYPGHKIYSDFLSLKDHTKRMENYTHLLEVDDKAASDVILEILVDLFQFIEIAE